MQTAYSYAEIAVFSPLVAATIDGTHYACPRRDGQAELAWVALLTTMTIYPRTVTHLSTNPARRRAISLMCPTTLPLMRFDCDPTTTYRARLLPFDAIRLEQKNEHVNFWS